MYVRGYLQGCENGRVDTIDVTIVFYDKVRGQNKAQR